MAIVDWVARLDGSDGNVVFYGCSYAGTETLLTATAVGPDLPLKAVVAACTGLDTYVREAIRDGIPVASASFGGPSPRVDTTDLDGVDFQAFGDIVPHVEIGVRERGVADGDVQGARPGRSPAGVARLRGSSWASGAPHSPAQNGRLQLREGGLDEGGLDLPARGGARQPHGGVLVSGSGSAVW